MNYRERVLRNASEKEQRYISLDMTRKTFSDNSDQYTITLRTNGPFSIDDNVSVIVYVEDRGYDWNKFSFDGIIGYVNGNGSTTITDYVIDPNNYQIDIFNPTDFKNKTIIELGFNPYNNSLSYRYDCGLGNFLSYHTDEKPDDNPDDNDQQLLTNMLTYERISDTVVKLKFEYEPKSNITVNYTYSYQTPVMSDTVNSSILMTSSSVKITPIQGKFTYFEIKSLSPPEDSFYRYRYY
jgi:hypothetical protein